MIGSLHEDSLVLTPFHAVHIANLAQPIRPRWPAPENPAFGRWDYSRDLG